MRSDHLEEGARGMTADRSVASRRPRSAAAGLRIRCNQTLRRPP